ncbi:MAG: TraR/DksA family transcriptional regulator [Acidimicrobiia bacterium]
MPDKPMPKLSPAKQAALADLLTEEELRTAARIAALTRDFEEIVEGAESSNLDDEHDPEGPTIGFERAQVTALLSQARAHQADLAWARERLAEGTYGRCERCGGAIGLERLRALPTATTCVGCAPAWRRSHA